MYELLGLVCARMIFLRPPRMYGILSRLNVHICAPNWLTAHSSQCMPTAVRDLFPLSLHFRDPTYRASGSTNHTVQPHYFPGPRILPITAHHACGLLDTQ